MLDFYSDSFVKSNCFLCGLAYMVNRI